ETFVDRLVAAIGPALGSDADARDLLAATIDAYLSLIEDDTHLYRFLSAHAGTDHRDLLAGLVAEGVAMVLERRLTQAAASPAPARPWAYGLVGMVHFAGDWWVGSTERPPRRQLVDDLLALSWH